LDSLTSCPYITGHYIIDVGTGGGLPGIPLSIMFPDKQFVLLDTVSKKTRFLTQACFELKLNNVKVIHSRVESYQPDILFDHVITRAFASISDMIRLCQHLIKPTGNFLAMKALVHEDELKHLPQGYHIEAIHKLNVPFLESERHMIIVNKQ
jgi:16S rRNA (guanine527-N7)-methyltransferase